MRVFLEVNAHLQTNSFEISSVKFYLLSVHIFTSGKRTKETYSFPAVMHIGIRCDPMESCKRKTETHQGVHEVSVYSIIIFPAWFLCTSQSSSPSDWQHQTKCGDWACSSMTKAFADLPYHFLIEFILYFT